MEEIQQVLRDVIQGGQRAARRHRRRRRRKGYNRSILLDRISKHGIRVLCSACGAESRHYPSRDNRLRHRASSCCGARMHPVGWDGWAQWAPDLGREEPVEKPCGES